jgi:hypothetical protein
LQAQKKIAGKRFFLQANAFFCSQTLFFAVKRFFLQANAFFCRQRFSSKKIADDENLSSYLSQGDDGLKKNNPYLIKLVRE